MRLPISILLLFVSNCLIAQQQNIVSKVFNWGNVQHTNSVKAVSTSLFSGKGAVLTSHKLNGVSIAAGKNIQFKNTLQQERFFIMKNGIVTIELNGTTTDLNRGSVVGVMPGEKINFINNSSKKIELYEMLYQSETPDIERAQKAGGSFITHWDDIAFKPHDKGGVRQFFDRPTAMLNRFDIHVTTLNVGFKSHDPHTHKNEEIILMLEGNAEMQIGTTHQKANAGDAVYLESNILHNLTNVGSTPCLYFAIQWN